MAGNDPKSPLVPVGLAPSGPDMSGFGLMGLGQGAQAQPLQAQQPAGVFDAYAPPAPQPQAAPQPVDLTRGYSFTEDEVESLASQQGADPRVVRQALEQNGATIVARPRARAAAAPGRPGPAPAGGGAGGFRGILGKELKRREAERDQAAAAAQEAAGKLQQANDALVGTQQAGLEIEAKGLDEVAAQHRETERRLSEQYALDMEKRRLEDQAVAQKQQEIDLGWKAYRDATIEDRRTPTEKTMALVGIALSGIADAMLMSQGRQGNFQQNAIGLVDAQIQRDVDRQLEKLNRTGAELTQKERALQTFRTQVGDDRAFREYLKQSEWENLSHVAEQIQNRTNSELKRNAAAELKAQADAQAAGANAAGLAAAAEKAQAGVSEVQEMGFTLALKQAMSAGKPKTGRSGYGLRVIDPNRPPEDAEIAKAQEIASGAAGIRDTIDALEATAAKGATMSPTERNIALRRITQLTSQFNGTFGDGTAPNEEQLNMYKEIFPNPAEWHISDVKREFEALRQDAKSQTNARIRYYNMALDDIDVRPE